MTFEEVLRWLSDSLGSEVSAACGSQRETATKLWATGRLREGTQDVVLINPREGDLHSYDIGDRGGLLLMEGDFQSAELVQDDFLVIELQDDLSVIVQRR